MHCQATVASTLLPEIEPSLQASGLHGSCHCWHAEHGCRHVGYEANRVVVRAEYCLPGKFAAEMDENLKRFEPSRPGPSADSSACPGWGTGRAGKLGLGRSKREVAQALTSPPLIWKKPCAIQFVKSPEL